MSLLIQILESCFFVDFVSFYMNLFTLVLLISILHYTENWLPGSLSELSPRHRCSNAHNQYDQEGNYMDFNVLVSVTMATYRNVYSVCTCLPDSLNFLGWWWVGENVNSLLNACFWCHIYFGWKLRLNGQFWIHQLSAEQMHLELHT